MEFDTIARPEVRLLGVCPNLFRVDAGHRLWIATIVTLSSTASLRRRSLLMLSLIQRSSLSFWRCRLESVTRNPHASLASISGWSWRALRSCIPEISKRFLARPPFPTDKLPRSIHHKDGSIRPPTAHGLKCFSYEKSNESENLRERKIISRDYLNQSDCKNQEMRACRTFSTVT